jgi:hypothetical protein
MILAFVSEIVCSVGDGIAWLASTFGVPILIGAAAGFVVPIAFRWESTPGDVRQHNREITDLNEDFRRFMSDLSRQVERQHRESQSEMYVEVARDEMVEQRREQEGLPPPKSILEVDDPELPSALERIQRRLRWERRTQDAMFEALWQFRDEALRKRGKFIQIVEKESTRHEWYRRWKRRAHPSLQLSEEAREALESWRKRPNPFQDQPEDLLVREDLTAMELALLPLETQDGLTWAVAEAAIAKADRERQNQDDQPT